MMTKSKLQPELLLSEQSAKKRLRMEECWPIKYQMIKNTRTRKRWISPTKSKTIEKAWNEYVEKDQSSLLSCEEYFSDFSATSKRSTMLSCLQTILATRRRRGFSASAAKI